MIIKEDEMMKLKELCPIVDKESGFYLTDLRDPWNSPTFYQDADDFYESPYARYLMERNVTFVECKGKHLNITVA